MKITTRIFQVFGIIGYAIPTFVFTLFLLYFTAFHGFARGLFLSILVWSFYILCVPSHHGSCTLEPLLENYFGKVWCTSPLLWFCALGLNLVTIFVNPSIYSHAIFTYLLYHIIKMPSPGWYILFASSLGTFYPWIIGQDAWHKPRYLHLMIYYFIKLFGLYVFFKFAYPQLVIIMNLVGTR